MFRDKLNYVLLTNKEKEGEGGQGLNGEMGGRDRGEEFI